VIQWRRRRIQKNSVRDPSGFLSSTSDNCIQLMVITSS
jgi:hypothetical protein